MAYPFRAELALAISAKYAESCALTAARLSLPPFPHPPAQPLGPGQRLRIAYVSSDFGNHPLSHLMGTVFGGHDRSRVGLYFVSLTICKACGRPQVRRADGEEKPNSAKCSHPKLCTERCGLAKSLFFSSKTPIVGSWKVLVKFPTDPLLHELSHSFCQGSSYCKALSEKKLFCPAVGSLLLCAEPHRQQRVEAQN